MKNLKKKKTEQKYLPASCLFKGRKIEANLILVYSEIQALWGTERS